MKIFVGTVYPVREHMKLVVPDWETVAPVREHLKIVNRTVNSVDIEKMAHYEPSHPDCTVCKGFCH